MKFDFLWDYLAFGLFLPLFCTLLFVVASFVCLKLLSRSKKNGKPFKKRIKIWIFLLFFVFVAIQEISVLATGSFHLVYEREDDAVVISGEITELVGTNRFPTFSVDYDGAEDSSGVIVTVNGIECKGHSCIKADFQKGDNVTITYLPNSSYILKIVKN